MESCISAYAWRRSCSQKSVLRTGFTHPRPDVRCQFEPKQAFRDILSRHGHYAVIRQSRAYTVTDTVPIRTPGWPRSTGPLPDPPCSEFQPQSLFWPKSICWARNPQSGPLPTFLTLFLHKSTISARDPLLVPFSGRPMTDLLRIRRGKRAVPYSLEMHLCLVRSANFVTALRPPSRPRPRDAAGKHREDEHSVNTPCRDPGMGDVTLFYCCKHFSFKETSLPLYCNCK